MNQTRNQAKSGAPKEAAPKAAAPKPAQAGAFAKPLRPSAALAAIVGSEPLPRTEVVKKVWEHIKANGLQDPANKRDIVADDKLRAVFGKDRATMFEMNALFAAHLEG